MKFVFGPVPSRRLGTVVGIDLVPHKVCTFDCLYCDLGRTTKKTTTRETFFPPEVVCKEFEMWRAAKSQYVQYVSICGSGEPTLFKALGDVVSELKRMTDIPLALVTNGSLLGVEEVQEQVAGIDVVLPSLDAVTKAVFTTLNRPHPSLVAPSIVEGLKRFRAVFKGQLWLEVCLCRGINDNPSDLKRLRDAIEEIGPDRVQLNTPVRAPSEDVAVPLTYVQMEAARAILGGEAEIISAYHGTTHSMDVQIDEHDLIDILRRHPATRQEIKNFFPSVGEEVDGLLSRLLSTGRIHCQSHTGKLYYRAEE